LYNGMGAANYKNVLIVNPGSGCALQPGALDQLIKAAEAAAPVHVHRMATGQDLAAAVRELIKNGADTIAVAGGDGTISSVVNELVGTEASLVPIPFGTLNHFCKDAGAPDDPLQAVRALNPEEAEEKLIDIGKVNSRYFINNSSLGLYPHLVKRREKRQQALGKWMAYAVALFEFLMHPVRVRVQLAIEEGGQPFHAGLIFVANNVVEEGLFSAGRRSRLDQGILQLFVLKHGTVWATLRAAIAFLRANTQDSLVVNEHRLKGFDVLVKHRKRVRVSCDGETIVLQPPIHYQVMPQALRIRVAKVQPATST
jgi:diacylglycerol kinase family enzyme